MNEIRIYHNPSCGTSRNVLAMIREAGHEPDVVEYLKTPPSRDDVRAIAERIGVPLRDLLREKEPVHAELDLGNPKWSDDEILDCLEQHPILLNRPIVVTPLGAALCRPADRVLALLPPRP